MEVVNARSSLLSNYEVYSLLTDLENEHISRTKTALRIKKEEEASGLNSTIVPGSHHPSFVEVSENLRTIEVEALKYLTNDKLQPIKAQTPQGITDLVKNLNPYSLTKAEKLQIINLAPQSPVELYVIVEELEDRIGDSMEDILNLVKSSLTTSSDTVLDTSNPLIISERATTYADDEELYDENNFVDAGEGAGIEGDLDVDDE